MVPQKLSRRERQAFQNREEIMEAAVELFAQKGFHASGVAEIAQRAEFGVGTLYRLFPGGKDHIYRELKRRVLESFEEGLARELAGASDPVEKVRCYIAASVRAYGDHPREMTMYLREVAGLGFDLGVGLPRELRSRFQACTEVARQALWEGMEQGSLRRMELDSALWFLRATINGFLMRWLAAPQLHSLDQVREMIEEAFFHGLSAPGR